MAFNPQAAIEAARDIATYAVEKAADIVEDAKHIVRGDVVAGTSAIVQDSLDIAAHAVERTRDAFTGAADVAGDDGGSPDAGGQT